MTGVLANLKTPDVFIVPNCTPSGELTETPGSGQSRTAVEGPTPVRLSRLPPAGWRAATHYELPIAVMKGAPVT